MCSSTPAFFMLATKCGSIGEMPPRTRGRPGVTEWMALPAALASVANLLQSGSSWRSQCDLLLGSFQIFAASIISRVSVTGRQVLRTRAALLFGRDRPRLRDER